MKKSYNATIKACFTGFVIQAIVNNFAPLLFLTFQAQYGIDLSKITLLVTFNFLLQLSVDLLSAFFVDKIGYRAAAVCAHVFSAAGLLLLAVLPEVFPDPFWGLICAVILYAIGGGLLEVIISPIMEACPTDNKEKAMSLLHSFYCWGSVGVITLSTAFFALFGVRYWKVLAVFWALLPIANGIIFSRVPIAPLIGENEKALSKRELLRRSDFYLLFVLMFTAGACELSITQWASSFAEKMLSIPKTVGDLAGPAFFALVMGCGRLFFGKTQRNVNLRRMILLSGMLCLGSYLIIALSPFRILSFLGFGLSGLSVAILWPGTFSLASARIRGGGTAMFALLALAGDLGCTSGPSLLGFVSSANGDNLRTGVLFAAVFPVILIVSTLLLRVSEGRETQNST
ncbi:MAG: MFS transporter [Clostridia bacterium]|nr:MFS transporter [Clostridia bacterium]